MTDGINKPTDNFSGSLTPPVYYVPPKTDLNTSPGNQGNQTTPISTVKETVQAPTPKPTNITREFKPPMLEINDNLNTSKYYPSEHFVSTSAQGIPSQPAAAAVSPKTEELAPVEELNQGSFVKRNQRALTKLAVFVFIIFIFGSATTVTITRVYTDRIYRLAKGVLYSAPLKTTVWQSYGSVAEAQLVLPLQTPKGRVDQEFLLDTGAVVSSLPREMAEKMGYDLAMLPRQTFKGFGNTTSFAYNAEMVVHFDDKEITLPVVFTEAQGSKALLGRKGLFDKFTILVDHKSQLVEIRE